MRLPRSETVEGLLRNSSLVSPPLTGGDKGEGEGFEDRSLLTSPTKGRGGIHPHPSPLPSREREIEETVFRRERENLERALSREGEMMFLPSITPNPIGVRCSQ
jgi:hypothetical protein